MVHRFIRHDIQGLRAISVLAVVIFHAWPQLLPGGFVGVDMFFVISGFVITQTLLKDLDRGGFSVGAFYRRRIRRIFPALFLVLLVTAVFAMLLLSPASLVDFEKSTLASLFFSSNMYFFKTSGYFEGAASLKPLLHTWSLSVEEQFYFLYPVAFVLLQKRFPKLLIPALLAAAALSLVLSESLLRQHPSAMFYLAPSRAFELLIGAILACPLLPPLAPRWRNATALAGLAMVGGALGLIHEQLPFPGVAALLPCLGVACILYAGHGGPNTAARMLSFWPLVLIGNLSYSLYLWHWPALSLARNVAGGDLGNALTVGVLLFATLGAILSFKYVEQPILRSRWQHLPYLRIGAMAMLGFSALCLPGLLSHGVPQRFSPQSLALFAASADFNPRRAQCHSDEGTPIPYARNCLFGSPLALPDTAVWGDSHGAELVVAIGERLQGQGRAVLQITASACPPALHYPVRDRPHCEAHNAHTLDALLADPRIRTIVLAADFVGYRDKALPRMLSGYRDVVERLRSGGKRVIVVAPIPVFDFDPPALLGIRNAWRASPLDIGVPTAVYRSQNAQAFALLDGLHSAEQDSLLPQHVLCDAERCRSYSAGQGVLFFNRNHPSLVGARVLVAAMQL
ncbi:MAG: acyltransferase [Rhodoferax sp.]|nr:acyltransferase [Rhodoferax sp.]